MRLRFPRAERRSAVAVTFCADGGGGVAYAQRLAPGGGELADPVWDCAKRGGLLVFSADTRMAYFSAAELQAQASRDATEVPAEAPMMVPVRVWLCGAEGASAEAQIACANRCLAAGGAVDAGIRLRVVEARAVEASVIGRPVDVGCLQPLPFGDDDPLCVDFYLHTLEWPGRACPVSGRVFLSIHRLTPFALAHEVAHLLGMGEGAHVDENAYLRHGNVMDRFPLGGEGRLTLGQLLAFHLDAYSVAARLRQAGEPGFPLRTVLREDGEGLEGPPIGFDLSETESVASCTW